MARNESVLQHDSENNATAEVRRGSDFDSDPLPDDTPPASFPGTGITLTMQTVSNEIDIQIPGTASASISEKHRGTV